MARMTRESEFRDSYGLSAGFFAKIVGVIVVVVVIGLGLSIFLFMVHPKKGELVVVLNKTGKNLTNDMILAPDSSYKGIQKDVIIGPTLKFKNPYLHDWDTVKAINIPSMKVGILIRKYGKPLLPGEVVARNDDEKGVVKEGLSQSGFQFINPYECDIEIHDIVKIEAGYVGLVTLLAGNTPQNPNVFVVKKGESGVQPYLLNGGTTYPEFSNPYVYDVIPIDIRSQRFEMGGQFSIDFLSKDGFDITVGAIAEWAPVLNMLPETAVKYVEGKDLKTPNGVIENIQRKLILPFARSYCRTIGGQHNAGDYITGESRTIVQNAVEKRLKEECMKEGVGIKSFVILSVDPSKKIRQQYERREIARREIDRFNKEIETQIGRVVIEGGTPKLRPDGNPEVDEYGQPIIIGGNPKIEPDGKVVREGGKLAKVIQERRKDREAQLGQMRQAVATIVRSAKQYAVVETTKTKKDLKVAETNLKAAQDMAASVFAKGKADADVTVMKNKAEAEGVSAKVSAFGSGEKYAEYQFDTKISSSIKHILSNTDGDGIFAELFERFASPDTKQQSSTDIKQQLRK